MRSLNTAIKMTLVTLMASLLSRWIGLDYWLTGGILALLSIQPTKRDSISVAIKRVIDVFFGLILATLLFHILGYNLVVFILIAFVFSYASLKLNISEGVVPGMVIVTHLLVVAETSWSFIGEEVLLVFVSIGTATLFNSFYPTFAEKKLLLLKHQIDDDFRDLLMMLSFLIKDPEYHDHYMSYYHQVEKKIDEKIHQVELMDKDILFQNDQKTLAYVYMRRTQTLYVKHMYEQAEKVICNHRYANEIALFIKSMSDMVGLFDEVEVLRQQLNQLLSKYRLSDLPKTREEFETRAILYQVLLGIESILEVKMEFKELYNEVDMK